MPINTRTVVLLFTTSTLISCTQNGAIPPEKTKNLASSANIRPFEISLPVESCPAGSTIYSMQDQSIDWTAYKSADEIPVEGIIKSAGWLLIGDQSEMVIKFSSSSLFSDDTLRDDRIKDYILGISDGQELQFIAGNIRELTTALTTSGDFSQELTISGQLSIYGVSLDVQLAVEVKRSGQDIKIASLDSKQINLQASNFLADQVLALLDIADLTSMSDTVDLDFEVKLREFCSN